MNEWYEAREDARSEYNQQILSEAGDIDLDEHVADAIDSGDFDGEVLKRSIEIVQEFGTVDLNTARTLKKILKERRK